MLIKEKQLLFSICLLGLILRAVFTLFFAESFFHRPNIYVDGDTSAWFYSIKNLIEYGSYTINPTHEYGYFLRMPGYSFLIGFFYLITGKNLEIMYPVIGWVQIFLDVFSIYLIYKISFSLFKDKSASLITALLYSAYPFIIVWNPVVYSESTSVFLMLLSLHLFLKKESKYLFWSGFILGMGILFRPQLMFLVPIYGILIILNYKRKFIKPILIFSVSLIVSYGLWPLRNVINHHKFILTQDLRSAENWSPDVISFMQYTYSVKSEWEPQFSSIIYNQPTFWPKEAYITKEDSIKLERAVFLSKNFSDGFAHWKGYWKEGVVADSAKIIEKLFTELRENQIKNNALNYWIKVPIGNLKKAIFKSGLNSNSSENKSIANILFLYRTLLILLGLTGVIFLIKLKKNIWLLFFFFFLFVYITLCFGTSPQMRNIEMRYFLQVDILLVIPAAMTIQWFLTKLRLQLKRF